MALSRTLALVLLILFSFAGCASLRPGGAASEAVEGEPTAASSDTTEASDDDGFKKYTDVITDEAWYKDDFIPTVQQRGAAIIKARGASSAASAASAALDHMRDWVLGTSEDWVSMGIPSDGSYGIEPGVIYSFPCTCEDGEYQIVPDLEINEFSRARMDATDEELREERKAVEDLL